VRKRKIYFIIAVISALIFSFSKFSLAEQLGAAPQETVEFINKTNGILQGMTDKIKEKMDLIQQGVDSGGMPDGSRVEAEIIAIIAGYREQIESLAAPEKCEEFKKIIVKLLNLMGQMHLALSKGDIEQYKLLAPQVSEYSGKMQKEIQSLQAYYKN